MRKKWRLAYLVSHPIQYQAPLLRRISAEADIDLTVFYCSDLSVREYHDEGFGQAVQWDVPLLDGYRYEFLPVLGRCDRLPFWRPLNHGVARQLKEQRFDALWVHGWGHWSHVHAVLKAHALGVRVLMRGEAGSHLPPGPALKQLAKQVLLRRLFDRVDAFLAIGTRNREFYEAYGIDAGRIFPMPYAVDNEFFQKETQKAAAGRETLRASLGLERDRPVILFASKLTERKHPHDLLEAYARLSTDGKSEPRPYLLFVGDGEQRVALETRARALGWRSIRFLGFKNQTELPKLYDLCDVFVLPSLNEPWGLVVNEAMNAGKAVVVSDQVGAGADLVHVGKNGVVFAAGNVGELTRALVFVLEDDRYVDMGKHSLEAISRWGFREDIAGLHHALAAVVGTA